MILKKLGLNPVYLGADTGLTVILHSRSRWPEYYSPGRVPVVLIKVKESGMIQADNSFFGITLANDLPQIAHYSPG
jgi:hypothetical protein